jgi:hypothetical protein
MQLPSLRNGLLVAGSLIALAVGGSPLLVVGADHLDAPALGGLSQNGQFSPHSEHGNRDINDVYAFGGSNSSRTVLAMTTNPAINLFGGKFGQNVRYILNVDNTGDAVQDLAYVFRFAGVDHGVQQYRVTKYTGWRARSLTGGVVIATGNTGGNGSAWGMGGSRVFAGVRSDPFFFDLTGFVGTVFGLGDDNLGDHPTDFFRHLNTNAVVIEVPDWALKGSNGSNIAVWGATQYLAGGGWIKADQMGRPAINTVFNTSLVDPNASTDKNRFNTTAPSTQRTAYNGIFATNVILTLTNIDAALDLTGAPYNCTDWDVNTATNVLMPILLPDVLTYDVSTHADGTALNGRALSDDVIDAELGITTHGCVTSDGVGPHSDYSSTFPYLGTPH